MIPRLAELIAKREGYGIPGVIPTTHCNPGDLEHAPGESHDGTGPVGSFATPAMGWGALLGQLQLYAGRAMTLAEVARIYWPPPENDPVAGLQLLCEGLSATPDMLVADAIEIPGLGVYPDEPT